MELSQMKPILKKKKTIPVEQGMQVRGRCTGEATGGKRCRCPGSIQIRYEEGSVVSFLFCSKTQVCFFGRAPFTPWSRDFMAMAGQIVGG